MNAAGQIVGIRKPSSPNADSISISYYPNGRVQSFTNGGTWNYAYHDASGIRTTTVTDPMNDTQVTTADISNNQAKRVILSRKDGLNQPTAYTYDISNRLDTVTTPYGIKIDYDYDTRGNIVQTKITPKPGVLIPRTGLPYPDIVTTAEYENTCTYRAWCNKPKWTKDAAGNKTDYEYHDTFGVPLTITQPAATIGADRPQTRYSYNTYNAWVENAAAMPVKVVDPVTRLTETSQCTFGSTCIAKERINEIKSKITYRLSEGLTTTNISPNSFIGEWEEDEGGSSTLKSRTRTNYFDAHGNLRWQDGPLLGTNDTTYYWYNAARQLERVTSPDPDGPDPSSTVKNLQHPAIWYRFNVDGQIIGTDQGTVPGTATADWASFVVLQKQTTAYDGLGRPTAEA